MLLPEISIRSHSSDQFVFDRVLYSNSYRINKFIPNATVVDIGAHIGAFSICCLLHGAANIHAFEPLRSNFSLLDRNLSTFSKDFSATQIGANVRTGFSKLSKPILTRSTFYELADLSLNTEENSEENSGDGQSCFFTTLDDILYSVEEDIYLLKLSAPKMELKILNSCKNIFSVKNLCFETSCTQSEIADIEENIKKKGAFHSSLSEKVGEDRFLFMFSRGDINICFSKYRTV